MTVYLLKPSASDVD